MKNTIALIIAGIMGGWLTYYFQTAKIFFDSKRGACEKLVSHGAEMFTLAVEWARAHSNNSVEEEKRCDQEFSKHVHQTWVLIGRLGLYAPAGLVEPFLEFQDELIKYMDNFDKDPEAKAVLLQEREKWGLYRQEKTFARLSRVRRNLIMSALFPWVNW